MVFVRKTVKSKRNIDLRWLYHSDFANTSQLTYSRLLTKITVDSNSNYCEIDFQPDKKTQTSLC